MKHILITGGAGFIGSHISGELIKRGYRVSVVDSVGRSVKLDGAPDIQYFVEEKLPRKLTRQLPIRDLPPDTSPSQILADPDCLYRMTPEAFETFVAKLYTDLGYTVTPTKRSHDGGVDLFIEKTIDGMHHRYIVQCKHTVKKRRKIGVSFARDLLGTLVDASCTAAILVTNALFSREALAFAKRHAHQLFCVDRNGLLNLIAKA